MFFKTVLIVICCQHKSLLLKNQSQKQTLKCFHYVYMCFVYYLAQILCFWTCLIFIRVYMSVCVSVCL